MAKITWFGEQFLKLMRDEESKRLRTVGAVVQAEIVRSMVSGRGIAAASQHALGPVRSSEKRGKVYIFRSRPGDPPNVQTGQLKKSIFWEYDAESHSVMVGTNLRYGLFLEVGTRRMAARPYIRPAVIRTEDRVRRILSARLPGG